MRLKTMVTYGLVTLWCTALTGSVYAQAPLSVSVTDSQGRFEMNFPADWEVTTSGAGMIALLVAGPATAGHQPTVNVIVESLQSPMSPQAYAVASERLTKVAFHNYTVVQESSGTVGGRPAYSRYYTWETNTGVSLYQLQVYITAGQTGFVVTGTTINDQDGILQDMPVVTRIIETFRVGSDQLIMLSSHRFGPIASVATGYSNHLNI